MKQQHTIIGVLLLLSLFFLPFVLMARGESSGGDAKRFAVVFKNTGNPYGEKEMEGFKNAIEEVGYTAILKAPAQPTVEGQISIIEELIAQRVNVIAMVANDENALVPVLKKAMNQGIKVLSLDSSVAPAGRMVHVNQADPEKIGSFLISTISEMVDGQGEIAILSATSQASNQNLWIEWMQKTLSESQYSQLNLVKIAYGDDLRDKSVSETEALLKNYPDLKGIIAPTTVGIAAAGLVLQQKGLGGKIMLTGLGLPSEMASYIKDGICESMYLWNPLDIGYLAGATAIALDKGEITGKVGESFQAGRLGKRSIIAADGGTEIMLGEPFRFDKNNIDEWKSIY